MKVKNKTFFNIHSWTGLTTGLMLFVICWSGTVAVFSHELDWLLNPAIHGKALPGAMDWQRAYDEFEQGYPNGHLNELNSPLKKGYSIEGYAEDGHSTQFRFYMDPATYNITEETSYFNVQRFFRSFHMALFEADYIHILGVPIGYFIVGLFGFVLLISTITGFLFYKNWRTGFFKLNIGKGPRRLWSDSHKLFGLWSLWFGLLIGLTGVWYLAEWWVPEPPYTVFPEVMEKDPDSFLSIDRLYKNAKIAYPELEIQRLEFYDYHGGRLSFAGTDGSFLVRKRAAYVTLDTQGGTVLDVQKPSELSWYARWFEAVDLLHFGKFGGLWSKWLYFIFGLALSALCLTGAYLQAKRQQLKMGAKKYRPWIIISYSLTLILLLMTTFAGINEIREYGTDGDWPIIPLPVTLFISSWTVSSLIILTYWMYKVK